MADRQILVTEKKISLTQLQALCEFWFGEMVKVVVDVERKMVAIGGDLHADAEDLLLQKGSNREDLWGINLFPRHQPEERIEYTALINVRPKQNNLSVEIEDDAVKETIKKIIESLVLRPDEDLV